MPIISRSPTRVDLAGGTLDIMPLTHILGPKKTVNVGVTLFAEVKVDVSSNGKFSLISHDQKIASNGDWLELISSAKLPWLEKLIHHFWRADLPPLVIEVSAKSPAGAGLGGSSCLGVCLASALLKARKDIGQAIELSEKELVQVVQDLETSLIRVPTGCQDYWGGVRGGVNIIGYPPGGVVVETLPSSQLEELTELLMLFYSGVSRASASNNWAIFRSAFEGDRNVLNLLEEIATISCSVAEEVKKGRWQNVFRLSEQEWKLRTKLWGDIETVETQRIDEAAKRAGAMSTRICGAGGGGVMAVFAEKDKQEIIKKMVEKAGGTHLEASVSWEGTRVKGEINV